MKKIEDKEKLVKLMWEALSNHEFSAWVARPDFHEILHKIGIDEWMAMATEWQLQIDAEKAELKRMAGDEKGYGFTWDELLKLEGKERREKIISIVNERYIGGSFALLGKSEFDDVMSHIYQDVYDIDFGCAIREVAEKFAFQRTRRSHYNKRTKKYYFT